MTALFFHVAVRYHMHIHRPDVPKHACASEGLHVPDDDIVIGHVCKTHLKAATPLPGFRRQSGTKWRPMTRFGLRIVLVAGQDNPVRRVPYAEDRDCSARGGVEASHASGKSQHEEAVSFGAVVDRMASEAYSCCAVVLDVVDYDSSNDKLHRVCTYATEALRLSHNILCPTSNTKWDADLSHEQSGTSLRNLCSTDDEQVALGCFPILRLAFVMRSIVVSPLCTTQLLA